MNMQLTVMLGFVLLSTCQTPERDLAELDWLLGHWERLDAQDGVSAYEKWAETTKQEYSGIGISLREADTLFIERLSLFVAGQTVYYAADVPENPEPVWFALTESGDEHATFENPGHDFPKTIAYRLTAPDSLHVRISGDERAIDFFFVKRL